MDEQVVVRLMEQCKLALDTGNDGWEERSDAESDDDCFVE